MWPKSEEGDTQSDDAYAELSRSGHGYTRRKDVEMDKETFAGNDNELKTDGRSVPRAGHQGAQRDARRRRIIESGELYDI